MKKAIAIIETAVFAAAIAAAYYFITAPLAGWVGSLDTAGLLSGTGHIYAALLIINVIVAIEAAFFYRLRKLGAKNLGISTRFSFIDVLLVPLVFAASLGLYRLVTYLAAGIFQLSALPIPLPQTPGDWTVLVCLLAISAFGAEMFLRGFLFNLLHTKRRLPLWLTGVVAVVVSFIPLAFYPATSLGFAAAAIPFTTYYIIRRDFWGSVIAQAFFLAGVVALATAGV